MKNHRSLMAFSSLFAVLAIQSFDRAGASNPQTTAVPGQAILGEMELREQLAAMPQVGLDQPSATAFYTEFKSFNMRGDISPDLSLRMLAYLGRKFGKDQLAMLPLKAIADCRLDEEPARKLEALSLELRRLMRHAALYNDGGLDAGKLREFFDNPPIEPPAKNVTPGFGKLSRPAVEVKKAPPAVVDWRKPEAATVMRQLLQAEQTAARLVLVERLAMVKGQEASEALARLAVFDLSPSVRVNAVQALAQRPANEFRKVLLDAFRYPWPAPAIHAAEVVVALKLGGVRPALAELAELPDPALPFVKMIDGKKVFSIREVVRINHLCNCVLCHPLALDNSHPISGRIPLPGEEMRELKEAEHRGYFSNGGVASGLFARADITFLRQEFSVVLPVQNPVKWPAEQRYDFVVRTRSLKITEHFAFLQQQQDGNFPASYPQRDAVLYALQKVTR